MVEVLLTAGADVNRASRKGTTAVIFAVWKNDPATLRLLVDAGADLTVRYNLALEHSSPTALLANRLDCPRALRTPSLSSRLTACGAGGWHGVGAQ
jgi:ankyrin repeat protein